MSTSQLLRALAIVAVGVACYLIGRFYFAAAGEASPASRIPVAPYVGIELGPEALRQLATVARAHLAGRPAETLGDGPGSGQRLVLLSLSRPAATALVAVGHGAGLDSALAAAARDLAARSSAAEREAGRLKVDVLRSVSAPEAFSAEGLAHLEVSLDGLWLPAADLWLLPEEVAARALVDDKGDLQSGRLRRYLEEGPRRERVMPVPNPGRAGMRYARLRFNSVVEGAEGQAVELYRGNLTTIDLSPPALLAASRAGGEYLLGHQQPDGRYDYLYFPRSDRSGESYNELRHAGTTYALFELFAATQDPRFRDAGRLGVEWLRGKLRGPAAADAAADFVAIESKGGEAKLGGAALAMLAMLEEMRVTGERSRLPTVQQLARFLLFQQEANGHFLSKYSWVHPGEQEFDSIYYPGEAILALTRLAAADGDRRWLDAARKGADWLILERDKGKPTAELPHDHWLLMGLNELHPSTGEARFLEHAQRIAEAIVTAQQRKVPYPDWAGSFYTPPRSTPAATRAEALVAMVRLAERTGRPTEAYRRALALLVTFQLKCQLTAENSFYLPAPQRARGGFRRGLEGGEVRIDYVQHNLSSLLGLRSITP